MKVDSYVDYISNNVFLGKFCEGNGSIYCGDDLIINGGYYAFSSIINNTSYFWYGMLSFVSELTGFYRSYTMGLCPVIKLDSSVYVIGGTGTYTVPYIISN